MKSGYNICILEDDSFLAGLYARKFETRGWNTTVIDGVDDIGACVEGGLDILIVDIESDGGAGKKFVVSFKKAQKTSNIPVVVLTSVSGRETVQEMMGHGVDAYLIKGHFVPNEVVEKIHRILESREV